MCCYYRLHTHTHLLWKWGFRTWIDYLGFLQSTSRVSGVYVVCANASCEWVRIIPESFMNEVFFGLRRNMDRSRGVVRLANPRAPERPRAQRVVGWRFGFFVSYFSAVNLSLCIHIFVKHSQSTAKPSEMGISKRMLILFLACSFGPVSINTSFHPVSHVIIDERKPMYFNTPSPQTNVSGPRIYR